jgi:hypothetical protein
MPIHNPTIINRGSLTYFFDDDHNRWRIYDSTEEPHRGRPYRFILPLGDARATVRCFAPMDKTAMHYVFTFRSDADRAVTAELLSEQLSCARPFSRRLYYASIVKPE